MHVCRQLQDARLREEQQPRDSLDQLMTEQISGSPCQSNSDNCVQVTDPTTHSSVQSECPQLEMTTHLFNYNSDPVQQYVFSSGGESSEDEQCLPSLITCAAEELNCQSLQKPSAEHDVTNVQQLHLRERCVFTGNVQQGGDNTDGALLSGSNIQQDFLAGNTVNGNRVHEMAEELNETYFDFADGIATWSNVGNSTSTHSTGNQHTNAVYNVECMGDAEMNEVESLSSEIVPASEVDMLHSSNKFSIFKQEHVRDTGISDHHEAETLVFLNDSSDGSSVINDRHDSVCRSVRTVCESDSADQNLGSSHSSVVECTDENEDLECHSAELHGSNIGCKQKLASG